MKNRYLFLFHRCFIGWLLCVGNVLLSLSAFSQYSDYTFQSPDDQMSIELSRSSYKVEMKLTLKDATELKQVTIERSPEYNAGFRQCKYISPGEFTGGTVTLVKLDMYPLPASGNAFYRVKTVNMDGVTRTYPPVRLPAVGSEQAPALSYSAYD